MSLPEQIRKQSEAVQELYKQLSAEATKNAVENTEATDDTAVATEAVETTADEQTATNNVAQSSESEQKSDETTSEDTLLQKYRTLQGMYNAEVPRLHQQNRELTKRIQQLEQLLATLSAQQQAPTTEQQQQVTKLVTEKDVEEYGESLDVMRRVSREELAPITQRLAQIEAVLKQMQISVVPQVQNIAQYQRMTAEQQFWADLAAAVPNFREINNNEAFQSWLLETDPLTGITRQTYLEDAQRNLDARRVANIFQTWLQLSGQNSSGRAASSELEKQISPGRSRSSGAYATTDRAKIYTPADIAKFFNDVRAGKYKGREQERDRIERDIFAAQRENRIRINA